jgi:hypothetical protein
VSPNVIHVCNSSKGLLTIVRSGRSNETCSSYVLATDINDQSPFTNYWCDAATATGGIIYEITPDGEYTILHMPII